MEKKSETFLSYNLIFIVLVVVFFVAVSLIIVRYETNTALYEEVYAKQLALLIDKAEPGMEMEIDITDMLNLATKNRFNGKIIDINNKENYVRVMLINGEGYSHYYFNDVDILWNVEKRERGMTLTLTFLEPSADSAEIIGDMNEGGKIQ